MTACQSRDLKPSQTYFISIRARTLTPPNYACSAVPASPGGASDDCPRRQPWVRIIQDPSPGRGERIRKGDQLLRLVFRPSGAHSWICLVPRLTPWANVCLSEANTVVHNLGTRTPRNFLTTSDVLFRLK